MKLLAVLAFVAMVAAAPEIDYERYKNFDTDGVIKNRRLFISYSECLIGVGKCTAEGNDLKEALPNGIQNSCEDCPDYIKVLVAKIISAAQELYPEQWALINKQYNPNGEYDQRLQAFVDKYKP